MLPGSCLPTPPQRGQAGWLLTALQDLESSQFQASLAAEPTLGFWVPAQLRTMALSGLNPQPWWLMGTSSPDRNPQPGSLQPGVAHSPLSGLGSLLDTQSPSALPSRPDRSLSRFPPHWPVWTSSSTQETHLAPGWAPRQSPALGRVPQVLGPSIC